MTFLLDLVDSDAASPPRLKGPPTVKPVRVAGRLIRPSAVFDTYWRFAAARQGVYLSRLSDAPGPWTLDPILAENRFTNCFRAADRVSQFLIREVAYQGSQEATEQIFRVLLFKLFNRVGTYQLLQEQIGVPTVATFDVDTYEDVLGRAFARGSRLYSAAYVIPPPRLGAERKHTNHLRFLRTILDQGVPEAIAASRSMREAYTVLRQLPTLGDFLAYQFVIDVNYSTAVDFSEMDFVVPGPGAKDGIRKCFGPQSAGIEAEVIAYMAATQQDHFERLGLDFPGLFGRPLQLVDCQNLFCEVDKYARVAHPSVSGLSGRTRIKQRFNPVPAPVPAWFPPKWGINHRIADTASRSKPVQLPLPV